MGVTAAAAKEAAAAAVAAATAAECPAAEGSAVMTVAGGEGLAAAWAAV